MTRLRRYLGERHRLFLWTLLIGGSGALVVQRVDVQQAVAQIDPELTAYATQPIQIGAIVTVWLLGALVVRRGERKAWQRLLAHSPFEAQNDEGRLPPLQQKRKRKTITAEPIGRGRLRQDGIRVQTIVDGVSRSLDVRLRYVGSGGGEEGIRTGNKALDDQFVLTVETGSDLRQVFNPEVQSALMDITVPGRVRIQQHRVTYDIPFTRVRPEELGTAREAVATIAARLETLAKKGY